MVNIKSLLINSEYVHEALDQIVLTNQPAHTSPLQFLCLVDLHMLTADFTFFQEPRKFALNDLLVSTIRLQYLRQRTLYGLISFDSGVALSTAINFIVEDATTSNVDLIGWSWLYFHYVEINLRISQQWFCHIVHLEERTIRRYQRNCIDQLADQLIRMEQNAREVRRKQILYLQLPHQGTVSDLIERESEAKLVRQSKFKHYYIVGSAGVGKTVFVEQVLKEQIDKGELDQIVWFHSPNSIDNIKLYLRERLLSEDSRISLTEYISLKTIAIVIDDSECLHTDLTQLHDFLQEFSKASIFLTSRLFQPMPGCLQIILSELSLSATQLMLADLRTNQQADFGSPDNARLIWQSVGGNPLAIELMVQNWSVFEFQSATSFTLDLLFAQLFDSMTTSEHLAWVILALLNDECLTLADLSEIDFSLVAFPDFVTLGRLSLAKTTNSENGYFTLTVSASQYVQLRYKTNLNLQHLIEQLITDPDASTSDINLAIIECALTSDWIDLNLANCLEAIRRYWNSGLEKGHYTKWYIIFGRVINELTPNNLDLAIAFGIAQRHLGQWSNALAGFSSITQFAGMRGLFSHQAHALLESAILFRYQGDYISALSALDRLSNLPEAISVDSELRQRATIERIEIALERNYIDEAKSLFASLPDESLPKQIVQLEICAKEPRGKSQMPYLASLGDRLLLTVRHSPSITARIHILLGRVYQGVAGIKAATRHLSIAQTLLMDIDNDPFALARTQSNLAALLLESDHLTEAQELLKSAENIQRKIGDRVGLATTIHNEHVLDRKIVN